MIALGDSTNWTPVSLMVEHEVQQRRGRQIVFDMKELFTAAFVLFSKAQSVDLLIGTYQGRCKCN